MRSTNEHYPSEDIFNILGVLAVHQDISQRNLARRIGVSLGKANYLLKFLTKEGLIEKHSLSNGYQNFKRLAYNLTDMGIAEKTKLTQYFLKKKEEDYLRLKREFESAEVNR